MTVFLFNDAATPLTGAALTDNLPAGVTIAGVPNASTTCASGIVDRDGGNLVLSISGAVIPAQSGPTPGTCTFQADVTSPVPGNHINTIPVGSLVTNEGQTNGTPASATLSVTALSPLTGTKSFSPTPIPGGGVSTATITLSNSNGSDLHGAAFTDNLPATVTVANPTNAATTCAGGSVSAVSGANNFSLSGGTIPAGGSCTITVDVTSNSNGNKTNTIPIGGVTTAQGVSNAAAISGQLRIQTGAAISKAFVPNSITSGGVSTLSVTITNGSAGALTNAALTDNLPAGVTIASPVTTTNTCGGALTAVAGASSFSLAGGTDTRSERLDPRLLRHQRQRHLEHDGHGDQHDPDRRPDGHAGHLEHRRRDGEPHRDLRGQHHQELQPEFDRRGRRLRRSVST